METEILEVADYTHLVKLGLALPVTDRWLRISPSVLHSSTYRPDVCSTTGEFPRWRKLPTDLQLRVMEECRDVDLLNLARASYTASILAQTTIRQNQAEYLLIPMYDESVEMLQFMGFSRFMSLRLQTRWARTCDAFDDISSLFAVAIEHLRGVLESIWRRKASKDHLYHSAAVMDTMGISTELQQAILRPEFDSIRKTEKLTYWVYDAIRIRSNALTNMQLASISRAKSLSGEKTTRDRLAEHLVLQRGLPFRFALEEDIALLQMRSHIRDQAAKRLAKAGATKHSVPDPDPAQTFVLWKGCDVYRTASVHAKSTTTQLQDFCIHNDAGSNMKLESRRCVAQMQAAYAEARSNGFAKGAVVKFSVPARYIRERNRSRLKEKIDDESLCSSNTVAPEVCDEIPKRRVQSTHDTSLPLEKTPSKVTCRCSKRCSFFDPVKPKKHGGLVDQLQYRPWCAGSWTELEDGIRVDFEER